MAKEQHRVCLCLANSTYYAAKALFILNHFAALMFFTSSRSNYSQRCPSAWVLWEPDWSRAVTELTKPKLEISKNFTGRVNQRLVGGKPWKSQNKLQEQPTAAEFQRFGFLYQLPALWNTSTIKSVWKLRAKHTPGSKPKPVSNSMPLLTVWLAKRSGKY